jgi:hypothetical protein
MDTVNDGADDRARCLRDRRARRAATMRCPTPRTRSLRPTPRSSAPSRGSSASMPRRSRRRACSSSAGGNIIPLAARHPHASFRERPHGGCRHERDRRAASLARASTILPRSTACRCCGAGVWPGRTTGSPIRSLARRSRRRPARASWSTGPGAGELRAHVRQRRIEDQAELVAAGKIRRPARPRLANLFRNRHGSV